MTNVGLSRPNRLVLFARKTGVSPGLHSSHIPSEHPSMLEITLNPRYRHAQLKGFDWKPLGGLLRLSLTVAFILATPLPLTTKET